MDNTYTILREFAGSWMLIAMMMFYITACLWAISPRRRDANADAAQIPFRNETLEASGAPGKDPEIKTDRETADQKKESV
ncbi:MAG: cbb3-type cytochrome c oxidase subunit 3 [Pseudomonadota bacterium]